MIFLAFLSAMMAGTFGLIALGVTAALVFWLVFDIHQEFKGGSGFPKLLPTGVLLALLVGFYLLTAHSSTPDLAVEKAATLSFGQTYLSNLAFGHICLMLAEYIGVGVAYSLFEARVTLWRDKKGVVKAWEAHLSKDISTLVLGWLKAEVGTSLGGNQADTTSGFKKVIGAGREAIARDWNHFVTWGEYTVKHAVQDTAYARSFAETAETAFKQDAIKFHESMKLFMAKVSAVQFNPNTAYLNFQIQPDGTLTTSVEKGALAICLANWTFWWWAYALNFIFGDMLEAIFTRFAAWVTKYYSAYVTKYFSDLGIKITPPAVASIASTPVVSSAPLPATSAPSAASPEAGAV